MDYPAGSVRGQKNQHLSCQDLADLDCEIDRIALAAFDMYMECREQLYQVRIKELKSGNYILADTPCSSSLLRKRQKGPDKD